MTLLMTSTLMVTLVMSLLMSTSPVPLGATILLTALLISLMMALLSTSWFSLITFIIYVGGMLVMFAYFAALQPNQHTSSWSNWLYMPLIFSSFLMLNNDEPFNHSPKLNSITALFQYSNPTLLVFLALLLFLALIAVVKISRSFEGPLRPFQYVQPNPKNTPWNQNC